MFYNGTVDSAVLVLSNVSVFLHLCHCFGHIKSLGSGLQVVNYFWLLKAGDFLTIIIFLFYPYFLHDSLGLSIFVKTRKIIR